MRWTLPLKCCGFLLLWHCALCIDLRPGVPLFDLKLAPGSSSVFTLAFLQYNTEYELRVCYSGWEGALFTAEFSGLSGSASSASEGVLRRRLLDTGRTFVMTGTVSDSAARFTTPSSLASSGASVPLFNATVILHVTRNTVSFDPALVSSPVQFNLHLEEVLWGIAVREWAVLIVVAACSVVVTVAALAKPLTRWILTAGHSAGAGSIDGIANASVVALLRLNLQRCRGVSTHRSVNGKSV